MKKLFVGMLLFSIAASGTAAAAPSLNGPSGLINTPSADVVREGGFSLGYDRLQQGDALNFNLGIMRNVEIGISSFDPERGARLNRLNAKWNMIPETVVTPGLAVGVEDINDRGQRSAYIVGSKALPLGFRVHYGLGDGRYNGVFGGIEKTINPLGVLTGSNTFPATTLIAEYDGDDFNVGARLALASGVKIDAGWQDMKDFYIGFNITK